MTRSAKVSLTLVALALAALLTAVLLTRPDEPATAGAGASSGAVLVRPDSPRLTVGDEVQLVEFLDFECEACGALYPVVEQLKENYGDRLEFVVRYMPLHVSSVNAALAAEAAREQDAYKQMYDLLFQRQAEWGHQQSPQREMFFAYADELGLDMNQFAADFDAPQTLARIEQSEADGRAAGVSSTPTFFLDGEPVALSRVQDLEDAVRSALDE